MAGRFFYPSSLLSLLAVILLHGGVGYGYYWWYSSQRESTPVITAAQGLEVYEFSLAGVVESEEVTNRHDDEVAFQEGADESLPEEEEIEDQPEEEPLEEESVEEELIEDELIEEDPVEEESPKEEITEEPEEEPEDVTIPDEEILTTDEKSEDTPEVLKPDPDSEPDLEPDLDPDLEPVPDPEPAPEPAPTPPTTPSRPKPQPESPPKAKEKVEFSTKPARVDQQQSKQVEKRVLDISEVSIIQAPPPNYPHNAVRRRQTGIVRIMMEVNEQGLVTSANVVKSSGHTSLDKEALRVAKQIRLNPYTINGVAHAITVVRNYEFSL